MSDKVDPGSSFELKNGESRGIKGGSDKITLKSVDEDSRCPEGAQCIWAGQAVVTICINRNEVKATFPGASEPKPVSLGGYSIVLESLNPRPVMGQEIDKKAYVAVLKIEAE